MENIVHDDRMEPDTPAPQSEERSCCCCQRMKSRTLIVNLGPQQITTLMNFLRNTTQTYEANGYTVLAHSLTDIGAGWALGLTIGWYE